MTSEKNLTRYTYEHTHFQGWRLNITRRWTTFCKYFPDKMYGGEAAAFRAAKEMRERIMKELDANPDNPQGVLARFRSTECNTDNRKGRRAA